MGHKHFDKCTKSLEPFRLDFYIDTQMLDFLQIEESLTFYLLTTYLIIHFHSFINTAVIHGMCQASPFQNCHGKWPGLTIHGHTDGVPCSYGCAVLKFPSCSL